MSGAKVFEVVGVVVATLAAVVLLSLLPTWAWFAIDGTVAHVFNNPRLEGLPFTHVWMATMMLSLIFKASQTNKAK